MHQGTRSSQRQVPQLRRQRLLLLEAHPTVTSLELVAEAELAAARQPAEVSVVVCSWCSSLVRLSYPDTVPPSAQ